MAHVVRAQAAANGVYFAIFFKKYLKKVKLFIYFFKARTSALQSLIKLVRDPPG